MSEYDQIQVSEWLRDGIAAAKAGRRDAARDLLMRVLEVNERSEQAWLWLSGVVDTDEDRLICLENVLALNPDNVQARAGLRVLQERGAPDTDVETLGPADSAGQEADSFMTPDGCVYCGLDVSESDARCSHCGKRLFTKRFQKEERSPTGYLLHAYWIVLASVNVAEFLVIGFMQHNLEKISPLFTPYLPYIVGPAVTNPDSIDAIVSPETWTQIIRYLLVGLSVLGILDALGLFLRRPLAHTLGLGLIALYFLVSVALFALGFSGYIIAVIRLVFVLLLTRFMFQTVEDFSQDEIRDRLEVDRHLLNDVDYYSRGRLYAKWGMWAKALLHWQRAAAAKPYVDTYRGAMARAYAQLGRYEQALEQVEEAIKASRTPEEWQPLRQFIVEAQRRATVNT